MSLSLFIVIVWWFVVFEVLFFGYERCAFSSHYIAWYISIQTLSVLFHKSHSLSWQTIPLYPLPLLLFISAFTSSGEQLLIMRTTQTLQILCLFISTTLLLLFPIGRLPKPTGKFKVGTHHVMSECHLTLPLSELPVLRFFQRNHEYNDNKECGGEVQNKEENENDPKLRSIVVPFGMKMWYPIRSSDAKQRAAYIACRDKMAENFPEGCEQMGRYLVGSISRFSLFLVRHLPLTSSNSFLHSPICKSSPPSGYPIIIFSPGQSCIPEFYSIFCEEWASHGYVVCSLYQNDDMKTYPGGLRYRYMAIQIAIAHLAAWNGGCQNRTSFSFEIEKSEFFDGQQRATYSAEMSRKVGVNSIDAIKIISSFQNVLNLQSVGLIGHSMGGSTTALYMKKYAALASEYTIDGEVDCLVSMKAGVCLDPWLDLMYDDVCLLKQIPQPVITISADLWNIYYPERLISFKNSILNGKGRNIFIKSTSHHNFTDVVFTMGIPIFTMFRKSVIPLKRWLREECGHSYFGLSSVDEVLFLVSELCLKFFESSFNDADFEIPNHDLILLK